MSGFTFWEKSTVWQFGNGKLQNETVIPIPCSWPPFWPLWFFPDYPSQFPDVPLSHWWNPTPLLQILVRGRARAAGDSGLAMMEIDFHDVGDGADQEDDGCCRACHATSQTASPINPDKKIKLVTKYKCEPCHGIHMLCHGELTWKETCQKGEVRLPNLCFPQVFSFFWYHFRTSLSDLSSDRVRIMDPNPTV